MEIIRYSYDQANPREDINKLMAHVEGLGYEIVSWETKGGHIIFTVNDWRKKYGSEWQSTDSEATS